MTSRPTRRTVLSAGAVGLAAGCTSSHRTAGPSRPDPDVALTAAAVGRERALLAAYDAALAAAPARATTLALVRAEHAAHLAALGVGPAASAAAAPASPAPSDLAGAERAAAAAHAAAAVTASPRLAQVLASLAASEAAHQVALG